MQTHKSFCRFCHAVCGIEVDIDGDRVVAVRGDKDHVVSQGYLCSTNRLVSTERDFEPISGMPRQSAIPVNIRPLTPAERTEVMASQVLR